MASFATLSPNLSTTHTKPRIPQVSDPNPLFRNQKGTTFIPNYPKLTTTLSSTSSHHCCLSSLNASFPSSSPSSSEFPLLPFSINEVLVPSESKTLYLYEARFLALLEESLVRKNKLFVHFVLDPIFGTESLAGVSIAARYCCLALIESVRRLDIGALVSIRGISRVRIVDFIQTDPYWKGVVIPLQDKVPDDDVSAVNSKVTELKKALISLNRLQIKLKAPKDEVLQTPISNSLRWAEVEPSINYDKSFIPSLAERLSFAGFQPVSGSSESELLALQKQKLEAMTIRNTSERLDSSTELIRQSISLVAAKLAIQSLEASDI